jgi:hypothetical protein
MAIAGTRYKGLPTGISLETAAVAARVADRQVGALDNGLSEVSS